MLKKFQRFLEPPIFDGDESKYVETRIANALINYLVIALLIVIFILIPIFAVQKIGSWILTITVFCGLLIGRNLLRKGKFRSSMILIFSIIYLCILILMILSGGSSSTAMFFFATVVLVAGFFLDATVVNGLTIPTFLIVMVISLLQNNGLLVLPKVFVFNSIFSWFITALGLLFMILTRDLFVGNLKNAIASAQQKNIALQVTEATLRNSEENFVKIFQNAPVLISLIDLASGTFLDVNEEALHISGFTRKELLGHTAVEIGWITRENQARLLEELRTYKRINAIEMTFQTKNKRTITCLVNGEKVTFSGHASLLTVSTDITVRKHVERALFESEKKYRDLFQVNKDGIAIFLLNPIGPPGTFVEVNDAAPQMLGYSREEMLQLSPTMLEPFTSQEQMRIRQSEFESKGIVNFETILLHKNGHPVFTEFTAQYIEYEGKPAIMNVVRDVTERNQREKELNAIATLSNALRTAATRAEMLPVIVEQVCILLNSDSISIELIDPITQDAVVEAAYGLWESAIGYRQPSGTGVNAWVTETRKSYLNNQIKDETRVGFPLHYFKNLLACAGVPLIAQDQLIGFLWMGRKTEIVVSEVNLLASVADIAANAIHRSTLHERTLMHAVNLSQAYDSTLEG